MPRRSALSVSATDLASHKPATKLIGGARRHRESCLSCVSFQALTPSLLAVARRAVCYSAPAGITCKGQLAADENEPSFNGVIGETDTLASAVVRCGSYHCCAFIQDDQSAWCWGESDRNQVGPDVLVYRNALRVAIGEPITEMALGRFFTCALVSEKTRCWGHGTNGLSSQGGTNSPSANIRIDDRLIDIANLSAGPGHLILTGQPRNQPERYGLFARGARNAELALGRGPKT